MNKKVNRHVVGLQNFILDVIIKHKGTITTDDLCKETTLEANGLKWTADLLKRLSVAKVIVFNANTRTIHADVEKLIAMRDRKKKKLPRNHNKLWGFEHTEIYCEMSLAGLSDYDIATKLERTEKAITKRRSALNETARVMAMAKKSTGIRNYINEINTILPE